VTRPRRFQKRQAQEPVTVPGGKGKRGGAAARVAEEMEAVEAVNIRHTQDPLHFQIETEVRRRLIPGVNLEILRDRIDALAQYLKQRRIRGLCRQYRARQQDDVMASRQAAILPIITLLARLRERSRMSPSAKRTGTTPAAAGSVDGGDVGTD